MKESEMRTAFTALMAARQAGFVVQGCALEYSITPKGKIALERMERATTELRAAMVGLL